MKKPDVSATKAESVISHVYNKLDVSAIKDGSVIDHIDSKSTLKVATILNIQNEERVVLVGMNLESKCLGKKGIIKIGGKIIDQKEVNKIYLNAPNTTGNIIRD